MTINEGDNSLKVSKEQSQTKIRLLVVIVVLLSIALGVSLWQYFDLRKTLSQKGSEVELLSDERGELQNELEDMLAELDTMETTNDSMKVEMAQRKEEIEGLLAKVKDKDFAIYKLKKETKTLRTIMIGYVVTIDSINTLNVGLRNENQAVRSTLTKERSRAKELEKTNENLSSKVALASRLDASNVSVFGVNVKRDLTGKETDRARKTDKLRLCFQLDENRVSKPGKRDLYIRILAPDGKILNAGTTDEYKFEFNGLRGYFSDHLLVEYNNEASEYCLDWTKPEDDYEMISGKYQIYLYAEDYEMAAVSYVLK